MRDSVKTALFVGSTIVLPGGALIAGGVWLWLQLHLPRRHITLTLPSTKAAFAQSIRDALGADGFDLVVAWAAWEASWGRNTGYRKANNPWNLTAGSQWTGPTVPGPDTEYDAAGNVTKITQKWRSYPDIATAWSDLSSWLDAHAPSAKALLLANDIGFVDSLAAVKYFTDPVDDYRSGVQEAYAALQTTQGTQSVDGQA